MLGLASGYARGIWDLGSGLETHGVFTPWDADAFLALCEVLGRYRPRPSLNGSAPLVQGGSEQMKDPALQVQAEAERTFLTFASRFGLTLSDHQSIKVEVSRDDQAGGAGCLLS